MIGLVPLQLPVVAVSAWPCCAVPEIVGSDVFVGEAAAAVTTAVCAEVAVAEPVEFDAVTTIRTVLPTSAAATVCVCAVSPTMSTQPPPAESQRRH